MISREMLFDDVYDIAQTVVDNFDSVEDLNCVSVVGKYNEIRVILSELIMLGVEIHDVELIPPCWEDYADEFCLGIYNEEDFGLILSCRVIKSNEGYDYFGSDIAYILENCNRNVRDYCEAKIIRYAYIKDEEFNGEGEPMCVTENNQDDMKTFSFSKRMDNGYADCTLKTNMNFDYDDIYTLMKKLGF